MNPMPWQTQEIASATLVTAPDGSAVRVLCVTAHGSMISFTLEPGAVSKAVAHNTVEETWYVAAGAGRLWRRSGDDEEVVILTPGVSVTIPVRTLFQFRNDGADLLQIIAVTMPPWPGEGEALLVNGAWQPSV